MGWNGSDGRAASMTSPRKAKVGAGAAPRRVNETPENVSGAPRRRRGLIAGLIVVIGAGLAAWLFLGRGDNPLPVEVLDDHKTFNIAEVAPQIVTNKVETNDTHKGMVLVRGKWYPEYNEKGGKIWISNKKVRYHTPKITYTSGRKEGISPERKIFSQASDQEIAILINTPIGTTFIGETRYDDRFVKHFLKSLNHPIEIANDDSDDVKALKQAVIETRAELKALHDKGEDIAAVMTASRKELQNLGRYRDELNQEVKKCMMDKNIRGDSTAIQELYTSANQMLSERNLPPLKLPTALLNNLKLHTKQKQ